MAKDAGKILNSVMGLIQKDVRAIKREALKGKLSPTSSASLVKYASALLSLTDSIEQRDREFKSKLSKLGTEELAKLAQQALLKKKAGDEAK